MPIYSVQGPDGRIYDVEGPEGASDEQVVAALRQHLSSQPKKEAPRSGVLASASKGLESLISSGRTAAGAATGDANEAARAALERSKSIGERYADDIGFDRVRKAYEERGVFPAAGEFLGQIPKALAEQAPNIAATLGSARLGATAGSVFGPAGSIAGGIVGAAAPGFAQMFGSNIERQAAEQQKAGRPINVDTGAAGVTALPQAALDVAGTFIPLGGRLVSKLTGIPAEAFLTKSAGATAKLAEESLLKTLAKGTATGFAFEVPTEVTQQMLERAQAGLPLTSPDALAEYGQTAYQVSLLSPLGAVGRLAERGQARQEVGEQEAAAQRAMRAEARAAQAATAQAEVPEPVKRGAEPEAAPASYTAEEQLTFAKDYEDRVALFKQLKAIKKPGPNALPAEVEEYSISRKQLAELQASLRKDSGRYKQASAVANQYLERSRVAQLTPEDYMLEQMGIQTEETPAPKTTVDEFGRIVPVPPKAPEKVSDAAQYLQEQVRAAREMGMLDLGDIADMVMQDPAMAAKAIKEGVAVEGLNREDNGALLGGVRLRLKALSTAEKNRIKEQEAEAKAAAKAQEAEAKAAAKAEMAQRTEDLGAQKPLEGVGAEQQTATALYEDQLGEMREGETNFDYLDPFFEKAVEGNRAISVPSDVLPVRNADALRSRIDAIEKEILEAQETAEAAKRARDAKSVVDARRKIAGLNQQLEAMGEQAGPYIKNLFALRRKKNEAVAQLNDIVDQLRSGQTLSGPNKAMAASTEQTLMNRANVVRANLITAALQEAALHRRAAGALPISSDEAIKAASKLTDTVNDMLQRGAAKPSEDVYEDVIVEPAQMRGNKIVRGARTERRLVQSGERRLSQAELQHFNERLNTILQQLAAKPEGAAQRADTGFLKTQFSASEAGKVAEARGETATTLSGELRRRSEYVSNLLEKAIPRAPKGSTREYDAPTGRGDETVRLVEQVEDIQEVLQRAKNLIDDGKVTRELLDAAENQARRVLEGRDLGKVTRLVRKQVSPGRNVAENIPGKEGSTRVGTRGAKFVTVGSTEDALYKAGETPIEPDEALRELKTEIDRIERPDAMEQRDAGQESLDLGAFEGPETEPVYEGKGREEPVDAFVKRLPKDDLGYIRATPANFAKSPRIKPVWEALAKARILTEKTKQAEARRKARTAKVVETVQKLKDNIEDLQNATQYFWKNQPRWSSAEIAKAFVPFPEIGTTPEEKRLVNKYISNAGLTAEESKIVQEVLRKFREKHMPEYAEKIKQAQALLAQGVRLDALDNSLAELMQSSNDKAKQAAKELSDRLAPMRTMLETLRKMMRGSGVLTDAQKKLLDADAEVRGQRSEFQIAVERAFTQARTEMEEARAALLDPQLAEVNKALDKAKTTLVKEQAELDKIDKRFKDVLTQEDGRSRTLLATYQLFRYEEKKAVIADLKAQIDAQETALAKLVEERYSSLEGSAIAAQAMLDKNVRMELNYLEMLEAQLAALRGENVIDQPNKYPFAARRAQANIDAQKAVVKAAEKRADDFKADTKNTEEKVKTQWSGLRRVNNVTQSLDAIREQERVDKLREEMVRDAANAAEKARIEAEKQAVIDEIVEEQNKIALQLAEYPGPMEREALVKLLEDASVSVEQKALYTTKLGLLQQYDIFEAQLEAIKEGKPKREPQPATAPSTAKMSAQKPLRTGADISTDEREATREANQLAEQIRGTKATPEAEPSTRVQRAAPDQYLGLFDEDLNFSREPASTVSFENNKGIVSNESVLGGLRRISEDDDVASENQQRVGAVMLTGLSRQAGGKAGRASEALQTLTRWADVNGERLVLVPAASGDLKQPALIKWYERNGFTLMPDGVMEREPASTEDASPVREFREIIYLGKPAYHYGKNKDLISVLFELKYLLKDAEVNPTTVSKAIAQAKSDLERRIDLFTNDDRTVDAGLQSYVDELKNRLVELAKITPDSITVNVTTFGETGKTSPPKKPIAPSRKFDDKTPEGIARGFKTEIDTDAAFNGMTFAEAARYGAARTSSPMVRMLFERLAEVFDSGPAALTVSGRVFATKGFLIQPEGSASGLYSGYRNTIFTISPNVGYKSANKTLLHELTHAATVYALNRYDILEDVRLNDRVEDLRTRVLDWLKTPAGRTYFRNHRTGLLRGLGTKPEDIYGLYNTKEFIAELYSDREFQKLLTQIPSDKPKKSIFTRFVQTLAQYFNFPGEAGQSLFAEAIALTDEVLDVTKREIFAIPDMKTLVAANSLIPEAYSPLLVSRNNKVNPSLANAFRVSNDLVAKQKPWAQRLVEENTGLSFATRYVDRFAGFERLAKTMDALKGTQMMYFLRMYDQRMNFVAESAGNGALDLVENVRADGQTEYIVESKTGTNLSTVVETLKQAKPMVGNVDAVNELFTTYLAAKRAERVGFNKLSFGNNITEAQLKAAVKEIEAVDGLKDVFEQARAEYNEYNEGLVRFAQKTGALSKEVADKLLASKDYIPYYRQTKDGGVDLIIGGENPIRVGSVKDQPYLHELVGGDEPIFDFFKSSVQNTNLMVDMSLRNLATKNAVMELVGLEAATFSPSPIQGRDVVQFKLDGKDMYARIDTDAYGIDADVLVKGMEGIPVQLTGVMRVASIPTKILRKAVTLSPTYVARQVFRDTLASVILSGSDFTPVLGALKEINTETGKTLERRGITGGQVFTGTQEDLSTIMRSIADGKSGWAQKLAWVEAKAMQADALTRRAQYNSYIKQGLSEMEATLASLESMNFNKRGASPSIHLMNSLIAFTNAQIQGLNVLYRALTGKATAAEKLRIQSKMLSRGVLMVAATLAYAHGMGDDEAYKNATPDQKYNNWFIRIPGFDEPIRLPIPFEVGYIFKALPEALYNMAMRGDTEDAKEAFAGILRNAIPGGSSYGIPQILKPAIEVGLGKSFYTGRDILSFKEQNLLPEAQYRERTSEAAKAAGELFGVSPIKLEALISGYTGTMGLALLQLGNIGFSTAGSPMAATKRASDTPVVGTLFQPNDAGNSINRTYELMKDAEKTKKTVNDLLDRGEKAKAMALLQERSNEYAASSAADWFQTQMATISKYEVAIRASNKSPEEKRQLLDAARQAKIKLAEAVRAGVERTRPQ